MTQNHSIEKKTVSDAAYVRGQLDEILTREITRLIEIDYESALRIYNLAGISCILIAVEREREIKNAPESPPERFTKETFFNELEDIGLIKDKMLMEAFHSAMDLGYLSLDENGNIKAEVSAYTVVAFLDNIFPGIQGLHLIAFIMQMNDEVLSNRKSLETAKDSFSKTLKNSGVSVAREKAEKKAREIVAATSFERDKAYIDKLKEVNLKRITNPKLKERLKLKRADKRPSFYMPEGKVSDKARVKSLFGKIETESKKEERQERIKKDKAEKKARLTALKKAEELDRREAYLKKAEAALKAHEERAKDIEIRAVELDSREREIKSSEAAALKLARQEAELKLIQAQIAAREAELKLKEEQLKAKEQSNTEVLKLEQAKADQLDNKTGEIAQHKPDALKKEPGSTEKKAFLSENDLASRIAEFESELAMVCPVCNTGSIVSTITEKKNEYFTCSNKSCRFVSWSKPYHFNCPMCKNPFLIEFETDIGEKGLKCPRASCFYSQNNLMAPSQNIAESPKDKAPKKKKRLVRRVKRKR